MHRNILALTLCALSILMPSAQAQDRSPLLLHLDNLLHLRPRTTAAAPSATDAVKLGLAKAKVYHFITLDYPGSANTGVLDTNGTTTVGNTQFNPKTPTPALAFLLQGNYRIVNIPGQILGATFTGINTPGEIVGYYSDASDNSQGFSLTNGSFAPILFPGATVTEPFDVNDAGEIVGGYMDPSGTHGFTYVGATFTSIDFPSATQTLVTGINTAGDLTGLYVDASNHDHGFVESGGVFTSLDFPLASATAPLGINDFGEVSGTFVDTSSFQHGFVYSSGEFSQVDVAGATNVNLARIKNNGHVTGAFADALGENHGFIGR